MCGVCRRHKGLGQSKNGIERFGELLSPITIEDWLLTAEKQSAVKAKVTYVWYMEKVRLKFIINGHNLMTEIKGLKYRISSRKRFAIKRLFHSESGVTIQGNL